MNSRCTLDYDTYKWLLNSINSGLLYDGAKASSFDMNFIKDDSWLSETSVIEQIANRHGTWHIDLLFAYYKEPLRFIIRKISSHTSHKQASLVGSIFRRQAAKDQRGTITIDAELLNINYN
ncbi:MAG: hypothetical protein IPK35_21480 [Saprospiraceae bacterium]|jgi:hypothetical protein|nr:hypothetical protein [Saprospiraceae bacterium]